MNAREMKTPEDVLLGWIQGSNERVARINAQKAISDLDEAGFVITPRSEVEAIREALQRMARGTYDGLEVTHMTEREKRILVEEVLSKLKSGGEQSSASD